MGLKQIQFKLENCYGIKNLAQSFDFLPKKKVHIIYASNGTMKTSFSKTMKDLELDRESRDQINPEALVIREIKFSTQEQQSLRDIEKSQIYTMLSIDQNPELKSEAQVANILLHEESKKRYEEIYSKISKAEDDFYKSISKAAQISGKSNLDKVKDELMKVLEINKNELLDKLLGLKNDIDNLPETSLHAEIDYFCLFNEKALNIISQDKNIQVALENYFTRFDSLIENSDIYKKGLFDFNNAENLKKQFKDEKFFKADHSINFQLKDKREKKINTDDELDSFLKEQLAELYKDELLNKSFNELNKALNKNQETKNLKDIIEKQRELIPELNNIPEFKRKTWLAYIKKCADKYHNLIKVWQENQKDLESLLKEASGQIDRWKEVTNIFNKRFSVPFKYEIENAADSVLGKEIPRLKLTYIDGSREKVLGDDEEKRILSTGEQRALYILHLIFEVESRKKNNQETIFLFDDIADSFDYKNKYAIIEYLDEIVSEPNFYGFILTHNFDFFRTLKSRLGHSSYWIASKLKEQTQIKKATESEHLDPFIDLKDKLINPEKVKNNDEEATNLITLIPFTRNLIEYLNGKQCDNYQTLTSLLHLKDKTLNIKFSELIEIYRNTFTDKKPKIRHCELSNETIYKKITDLANKISENNNDPIDIKSKLILSIAIRLLAEDFMKSNLNDNSNHNENQTRYLYNKYKETFPSKTSEIDILKRVNLIIPENIHLNSFMYEPILDNDIFELKSLYKDIKSLGK